MKKNIVVLGLGNPLMSDEGIGGFIVERLGEQADKYPDVEFLDAGTGGMSLLHLISERRKAILIDCAYMGTEPGTMRKFTPDEAKSVKRLTHFSLHEIDILRVVEMAKQLGQCPERVVIFGIEPEIVTLGPKISDTLSAKVKNYISQIFEELAV